MQTICRERLGVATAWRYLNELRMNRASFSSRPHSSASLKNSSAALTVSTLCCRASFRAQAPSGAMSLEVMETQSETLSSNAQ
jgi:hypothetical protein